MADPDKTFILRSNNRSVSIVVVHLGFLSDLEPEESRNAIIAVCNSSPVHPVDGRAQDDTRILVLHSDELVRRRNCKKRQAVPLTELRHGPGLEVFEVATSHRDCLLNAFET